MRVCSLPFIIRSTSEKNSTEALSLSASTWSLSTIFSGLMISGLDWISSLEIVDNKFSFSEYNILWIITIIGLSSYYFAMKIDESGEGKPIKKSGIFSLHKYYFPIIIFM